MASYQSNFDAPSRPDPGWKPGKSGNTQGSRNASAERRAHRELDTPHLSGEMDIKRVAERSRTQLPKPASRGPLPVAESRKASFGFKEDSRTVTLPISQPLKAKHSRNVLRRKQSSIAQNKSSSLQTNAETKSKSAPIPPSGETFDKSAGNEKNNFKNRLERYPASQEPRVPHVIPELDRYRVQVITTKVDIPLKISTQDNPPPTPLGSALSGYSRGSGNSAFSASPSTRFSESPGPGPYSRDTTPTSMSSASPSVVATGLRITPRLVQLSPNNSRPPLTRRRTGSTLGERDVLVNEAQGLPVLREASLTSSSSAFTEKEKEETQTPRSQRRKKISKLSESPPSPPPRKSSQKFKKTPEKENASPSKISKAPASSVMSPSGALLSQDRITSPTMAPSRPSRENTPSLGPQFLESPVVIQSNMHSLPMSPERRRNSGLGYANLNTGTSHSSYDSNTSQSLSRQATPAISGLGIVPKLKPVNAQQSRSVSASRSPSPNSSSASRPRFGFFKRSKTTPELPTVDPIDKRKGPAAGTGHEGYGRYGLRGRSSSTAGRERSQSGASSSQDSFGSHQGHDPFLLERMSPVVIAGGGEIIQNRNDSMELSRIDSSISLPNQSRPSMESKASYKSNLSRDISRTTLWPSALLQNPTSSRSSISLVSKASSDYTPSISDGSIAVRRSVLRMDKENEKFRLPAPIKVSIGGVSPAMSSLRTDGTSYSSGSRSNQPPAKKLTKRSTSPRKWNFFRRNKEQSPAQIEVAMPVAVAVAPERSVPHYAAEFSEQEYDEPMDIEDILRDAEVVDLSKILTESPSSSYSLLRAQASVSELPIESQRLTPDVLPPLSIPSEFVRPEVEQKVSADIPRFERPSRLPQVGRIPKVVSARPEQTSPKSFSRPFARVSMIQPLPKLKVIDRQSIGIGPGPSPERSPSPAAFTQTPEVYEQSPEQQRAFLVISPRKDSETGTSSSSCRFSMSGITAVVPEPNAAPEEDEVWDEYNDLIGTPENKVPVSATSSHGVPFQYESYESRRAKQQSKAITPSTTVSAPIFMETPKLDLSKTPKLRLSPHASTSVYSPDLSKAFKETFGSLPTPVTPISFGDFISGYGERNASVNGSGGVKRLSSAPSNRASTRSKIGSASPPSRDSEAVSVSDQPAGPAISEVDLRVGSMNVSKWLTFGHVLFSPAREDIYVCETQPTKHHSVLVVDGLGNDDWSFYAAETYPNATFYNLSPRGPSPTNISPLTTPPNHRQVQHLLATAKFPFPREFFSTVVVRFPSASPETHFRHLISEAKRCLKPGGNLEMSILDLDMMNMGNRCRRAIRGLKTQLSVVDSSLSLASASDIMLKEMGKRGFVGLKSCRVGVPVSSIAPHSETPSMIATAGEGTKLGKPDSQDISLADMMIDESMKGDESVVNMVARVGRWWWSRCYQRDTGESREQSSSSLWDDDKLIDECERWGTSFKLLVAYAQKPVLGRRRTASV